MTAPLIALDIGGTKAHLIVESEAGDRLADVIIPSSGWDAEPATPAARWIVQALSEHLNEVPALARLAVGAQGVDSLDTATALERELARLGFLARVVNDAALVVPAAGLGAGIGIIAGTGAIGVGADAEGRPMVAGGWGWILGDEGSAVGLVREATRAALLANDEGRPDDGLLGALLDSFEVADAERLARRVNDEPTIENWAPHAPAVFAAADGGSRLALSVIHDGARHLAELVSQLRGRGATGADVVAAGSVIVNQPRLFRELETRVGQEHPDLTVRLLTRTPAEGALVLARRIRLPDPMES